MIASWARVRHGRFAAHPEYRNDAAALAALTDALTDRIARARERGAIHQLDEHAWLAWWREPEAWHGAPAQIVWLDHVDDPTAAAWLCARLDKMPIDPGFECMLDARYHAVRRHLLARGFGIDSVSMLGDPAAALAALRATRLPARTHPAVEIRPLTEAVVPAVVDLYRAVFSADPDPCWFGANPAFLAARAVDLSQPAEGPRETLWQGDRLVGYWAADIDASAFWGRAAGMDFVLRPAVQGLGLAGVGYRRLLEALVEAQVPVFKGGTNQPAVLHLARRMGRRPWQTWIRRHAPHPPAHFSPLLAP